MASISKHILFLRMTVKIYKHLYSPLIFENLLFQVYDFRGDLFLRVLPLPIKIVAMDITARIADYDPIRIDHWDQFDQIIIKQFLDFWR